MNKTVKYLMHPVSIGCFVIFLAIGMSYHESGKTERKEAVKEAAVKSVEARLNIKVECINGVEYWLYKGTSDTLMLTPKYRPLQPRPDTCKAE